MKVLLAIDGSPYSDAAIEEVAMRAWPLGTTIKIFSVFEMPLPATPDAWALPPNYLEEVEAAGRQNSEKIVQSARERLEKRTGELVGIESKVVLGSPRSMILEEAETWGADLIIMGSHGYSAWERFLLGSVSQGVVSHAKCSVEVARLPRQKSAAA